MNIDVILSAAFQGGLLRRRELRLTREQADYITQQYTLADLCPLGGDWYEICFKVA